MMLALTESKKALPACLPNPPVGCTLVKQGEVVATGFTKAPGEHHAEADALVRWTIKRNNCLCDIGALLLPWKNAVLC